MATITMKDGTEIYYKDWGNHSPVIQAGRPLRRGANGKLIPKIGAA
jgi:hypothetical protein